jgi:hypothetical protein
MMVPSQRAEAIGNEGFTDFFLRLSIAQEEIELEDRPFQSHTDCDGKVSIWRKFVELGKFPGGGG